MNENIMQIGGIDTFETDGNKWLEVRYSDGEIEVSAPSLSAVRLSSGEVYDVSGVDKLTVRNVSGATNKVTLQAFNRLKVGNLATDVAVTNKVIVERIEEAIQVVAQATVENGTMHVIVGSSIAEQPDKTIDATSSKELLAANPNRKKAIIQIISDTRTGLRFGGATVAAGRGVYAAGSKTSPAMYIEESTGAIHAYNEDGAQAKVTITEVLR